MKVAIESKHDGHHGNDFVLKLVLDHQLWVVSGYWNHSRHPFLSDMIYIPNFVHHRPWIVDPRWRRVVPLVERLRLRKWPVGGVQTDLCTKPSNRNKDSADLAIPPTIEFAVSCWKCERGSRFHVQNCRQRLQQMK